MPYIQYDMEEDRTYIGNYYDGVFVRDDDVGYYMNTHARDSCAGEWCAIHNQNPEWDFGRLFWRVDRGIMERICEHGVGHPAEEQREFFIQSVGRVNADIEFIHACDGCCLKH